MSIGNFKDNDPFKVERVRSELSEKNKLTQLKSLYRKSFPEISDLNTPKLWDYLNIDGRSQILQNPMEEDRINKVASLIVGSNQSVLNIGFGSANLEKIYLNNHKDIQWFGIDISQKSVDKASKLYSNASFKLGDIKKLKHPKNSFDYVIALEVLEHIKPSEIFKALKEIFRVTKPGKYIIISVPLNENLEDMINRGENPNAHVRVYSPALIKAELNIVGFKILKGQTLFAFNKFYKLKTLIAKYFLKNKFKPNNIIIFAQKPK